MSVAVLDACENPSRCSRMAVKLATVRDRHGDVAERKKLCAHCADGLGVPDGYDLEVADL